MEYRRSEIGAGIFLLVSFVVLAVMAFAVSDVQSLFKKKKEIKVLFQYSDGIEKNAPVRYAGNRIGKVSSIRVAPEYNDKIELTLSIYRDTPIRIDTKAAIRTLGLVGGKYVELTAGSAQGQPLPEGSVLIGEESFKLEDLTRAGMDAVVKLNHLAGNLDALIGDRSATNSVRTILKNLQDASANLKDMTSNKKDVAQAMKNLQDASANLKDMTSNKEEVAQTLKNLPSTIKALEDSTAVILKKLDDTSTNLKVITEKTDTLFGDNKKKIDETLDNIRQVTQNLKETTDDIKSHPWKLIRKP